MCYLVYIILFSYFVAELIAKVTSVSDTLKTLKLSEESSSSLNAVLQRTILDNAASVARLQSENCKSVFAHHISFTEYISFLKSTSNKESNFNKRATKINQ